MKKTHAIYTCLATVAAALAVTPAAHAATAGLYHFTGSAMNLVNGFEDPSSVSSITSLGDGTAIINSTFTGNQVYWYDGSAAQRGSVGLDNFDGANVLASLRDGTALMQTGNQYYWFNQTTLVRGSVGLDNFDGAIAEVHPLGTDGGGGNVDGTALVKLNAANSDQLYWFNQTGLIRGGVSLDNFDGATVLTDLRDGTALLGTGGQYYWFDQSTLQRGSVGLDNFDGAIEQIHPLGDGTSLMRLNAANNNQIYWFDQTTLQRGGVNLDNFDGATIVATLEDGTAILRTGNQFYWFDQATLQRGTVGLDNFDGAIEQIHPLGDGTALMRLDAANNNQLYWFDQTTLQRGGVNLDNFDGATFLSSLEDGTGLLQAGQEYYYFNQTTLLRGTVGLDGFDGQIGTIHPLGDGTALIQVVPEPGTVTLFLAGGFLALHARRRMKRIPC